MNLLKSVKANLAKKREAQGVLSGSLVRVGSYQVKVDALIGEGGFASIYRCTDVTTQNPFALKHFRLSGDPDAVRDVQTEVAVMRALGDCPHALHLHAAGFAGPAGAEEDAYLLLDLCQSSLVAFLQARSFKVDTATVLRVFLPVARAVEAMHCLDPPLAHRDVKAENCLLHASGAWVLCDFGSATSRQKVYETPTDIAWEEEAVRRQTTPAYRAPEMWDLYSREVVGVQVDVWALGVLLYLLCFGRLPFDPDAKLQILNGRFSMPEGQRPEGLCSLIRGMLAVSPVERITIAEVVRRLELPSTTEAAPAAPAAASRPAAAHTRVPSMGWSSLAVARTSVPEDSGAALSAASGAALPSEAPPTKQPDGWACFSSPTQSFKEVEPPQQPAVLATSWGAADFPEQRQQAGALPAAAPSASQEVPPTQADRLRAAPASTAASLASISSQSGAELDQARGRIAQLEQRAKALERTVEERTAAVGELQATCSQQAAELAELRALGQSQQRLAAEVAALKEQRVQAEKRQAAWDGEMEALQRKLDAQAVELQQLRQRQQQPGAPRLQVDVAEGGAGWVDFKAGGSANAPTPTLLQPQAGRAQWQAPAPAQGAVASLENLLQSSLELGGGGAGRRSAGISRVGSMNASSRPASLTGSDGPSSFPLELTPPGTTRSSDSQSASPPKSRLSKPGSPRQQLRTLSGRPASPSKGEHRRHLSEPFFNDLNPLGGRLLP